MYIFKLTQLTILSDSLFPCLLPILTHKNRKSFLTIYPFQSIPLSSSNSFCFMLIIYSVIWQDTFSFGIFLPTMKKKRLSMRHLNIFSLKIYFILYDCKSNFYVGKVVLIYFTTIICF